MRASLYLHFIIVINSSHSMQALRVSIVFGLLLVTTYFASFHCITLASPKACQSPGVQHPHLSGAVVAQRLQTAYPNGIISRTDTSITTASGATFSTVDRARPYSSHDDFDSFLDRATLADMVDAHYNVGPMTHPPAVNEDPGRARFTPFLEDLYGRSQADVVSRCVSVPWVDGSAMRITTVNNVHLHLRSIVQELRSLPDVLPFLRKPGGSFNWRSIAGTTRRSAHAYGIAVDINVTRSDYWRTHISTTREPLYRNRIPRSIVEVFERHGFIWGGRWYHFDTMHFEFRPELCTPRCTCTAPSHGRY